MRPELFRKSKGFKTVLSASIAGILVSGSAKAATFSQSYMSGAAAIAIALGGIGFGVAAALFIHRWRREGADASKLAQHRLAALRAGLDEAQAILEGMPEITICWHDNGVPRIYGPAQAVLPQGMAVQSVVDFDLWLSKSDQGPLRTHITALRSRGIPFSLAIASRSGKQIHAVGRVLGGAAIVRLRPSQSQNHTNEQGEVEAAPLANALNAEAVFSVLDDPAWVRDINGELIYVNAAYRKFISHLGGKARDGVDEFLGPQAISAHLASVAMSREPITIENAVIHEKSYDMVLFPLTDGTAGYLRGRQEVSVNQKLSGLDAELSHVSGIIDALSTPLAVFDGRRKLLQFNRAYRDLWNLDPNWLKTGVTEQAILDRLRTLGQLPAEVDYRAWRTEHLKSYGLSKTRESLWHLPDGRAINVVAVPASSTGGVIYVFEDMSERLALESRYNGLIHVQSETLNALGEGVAVFGTNGRLTLSNPRLASIWKLPMNRLGQHPHIDDVGAACASAMPEDGATIWHDLKQSIIDLNPTRTDKSGRIKRADGRLVDYASVRLPDGQTLMTFADVTEIANYQRVLKERNDALVTADRLKDAFVQNVSYELRSPLPNIIGFADLLATGQAGPLNERQKAYTDYILTSSQTLGVLINNILDLATVDAGVVELQLAEQDIGKLVERARAGLASTLNSTDGNGRPNLVVDIAPNLPTFIADGTRVVQILYNLLSNAVRFSESGAEIRLSVKARGADRVVFVVEDSGVGFSEDMKAIAFRRFESQPGEGRQKGTGLGLAIVRTFVHLHGGTITLENREPKGTRVIVNMPASAAQGVDAAQ